MLNLHHKNEQRYKRISAHLFTILLVNTMKVKTVSKFNVEI